VAIDTDLRIITNLLVAATEAGSLRSVNGHNGMAFKEPDRFKPDGFMAGRPPLLGRADVSSSTGEPVTLERLVNQMKNGSWHRICVLY
jgi:hypothetical protein